MNHEISYAFDEIVAKLGSEDELDSKTVEQQFQNLLEQITYLEELDKCLFYRCRHRYHTLRVAYFRRINNGDKAIKEESLLNIYATLHEQFPVPEAADVDPSNPQHLNGNTADSNHTMVSSWEDVNSQIASLTDSADVDEIIGVIGRIRKSLDYLLQGDIRTLDECLKLQQNCATILSAFEVLKISELQEAIEDVESNSTYLDSITDLIDFVSKRLEDRQVYFASVLLSDPSQLKELLFHDVPQTKQCITRRYYEWARIFHSDKHYSSSIFDELMKHINSIRDQYLSEINSRLENNEKVQHELDEGNKHCELSRAYKERCNSGNDHVYSVAQLKRHVLTESLWAFEHYRAALKHLGKMKNQSSEKDILQRVEILAYMGSMLRQADGYEIEAQLYIVAGIYIITLSTMTIRLQQKLRELQVTLAEYQQSRTNATNYATQEVSVNTASRNLILCTNQTATIREIHDETQVFVRETILRQCVIRSAQPASIDITKRTLEEEIFATLNSRLHIILPILTGGVLQFTTSIIKYGARELLHKLSLVKRKEKPTLRDLTPDRLMATTRGSETISLEIRFDQFITPLLKHGFRADKIAHLLVLVGEVLLRGLDFSDPKRRNPEYTALLEQSKILFQGVFDSGELRTAARNLDVRVERYHHAKFSKSLAAFVNSTFYSFCNKDIEDSLDAPFVNRLDGYRRLARLNYAIACLLAAGSENFERCKYALKSLKQMTKTSHDKFFVIPDERVYALEDLLSAFGMDDDDENDRTMHALPPNITISPDQVKFMKTSFGSFSACKRIVSVCTEDNQLALLDCLIPSEHHFDCEEFIRFMLNKNPTNEEHVTTLLRRERIATLPEWAAKFRTNPEIFRHSAYLPLLSEFGNMQIQPCDVEVDPHHGPVFVAISSQMIIDQSRSQDEPKHLFVVVGQDENHISAVFTIVSVELNKLHSLLNEMPLKDPRRAGLLLNTAKYYEDEARRMDKRNHLAALSDWQQACNYYKQLLEMFHAGTVTEHHHQMAMLGYCRCMVKLHRYSRLDIYLKDMYNYMREKKSISADLWLIYAQARRKAGDYNSAKLWIQKAIEIEPLHFNAQREQKAINLRDERKLVTQPTKFDTRVSSLGDQQRWCNILSIDGGGIRGVIPAVWLMELERKIRQPVSSMFDVIAGTSTGAIIAAGLSMPSSTKPDTPYYQAYDLVDLYRTRADEVFTKSSSHWASFRANYLKAPRYLDNGRKTLFKNYFGALKLSDTLTELVVPSVKAESNITDTFTRQSAITDSSKNFLVRDVLMCTTAAPTYFPPYSFNNTAYADGGVQVNNPAMIAYSHALQVYRQTIDRNRIRLVSLGTGDYVPDPLHPTAGRDILFWYQNNETVLKTLMDGPQNNTDMHLGDILGDNYYRWQVWLENPIKLDDIQPGSIERLVDLAYEQLEEMEAYDNNQRLGCLIEQLHSPNELPA